MPKNRKSEPDKYKTAYEELCSEVVFEHPTRPIQVLYLELRKDPKQYQLFNKSRIYNKDGSVKINETPESLCINRILEHVKLHIGRVTAVNMFFELESDTLKFFAQKFPVIYLRLFAAAIYSERYGMDRLRPVNEVPYLREAYRNIPTKLKAAFDRKLLDYYKVFKYVEEEDQRELKL